MGEVRASRNMFFHVYVPPCVYSPCVCPYVYMFLRFYVLPWVCSFMCIPLHMYVHSCVCFAGYMTLHAHFPSVCKSPPYSMYIPSIRIFSPCLCSLHVYALPMCMFSPCVCPCPGVNRSVYVRRYRGCRVSHV